MTHTHTHTDDSGDGDVCDSKVGAGDTYVDVGRESDDNDNHYFFFLGFTHNQKKIMHRLIMTLSPLTNQFGERNPPKESCGNLMALDSRNFSRKLFQRDEAR